MNIAKNKKQSNIAEYLIYIYKTEELIRTFNFDIEEISEYVIKHFPLSPEEKEEQRKWYSDFMEEMKSQGIEKSGHMNEANDIVEELCELHIDLLVKDENYQKLVQNARPYLQKHIALSDHKVSNPIQVCLNAIYGFLLLELNKKKIDEKDKGCLEVFGDMLSFLSHHYNLKHTI